MRGRSLSMRLVAYLAIAQILALFFLAPLTDFVVSATGVNPDWDMSLDDWGEYRAHALMLESLSRAPDGAVVLAPSAAMRDYARAHPQVRFAAFDRAGAPLAGSAPELVAALSSLTRIDASLLKFHIPGDPDPAARGFLRPGVTPFGPFAIVAYGYKFAWSDLLVVAGLFLTLHSVIVLAPTVLGAMALAWIVVRRGLAPLHDAAAAVARIDIGSLHQRIAVEQAPKEVAPFIAAVNATLARLDAGVDAQRRFIANAAHELRTPIAILKAHADTPDDGAFRRAVRRDIRRLQTIVEQLLATARSAAREAPIETIDLREAVLTLVADYTPLVIENHRRIAFHAQTGAIPVRANRWALECVLANLLDNALRAEPEGGTIDICAGAGGVVSVSDHGEGVRPADREKLFEPFWRKDMRRRGTGLGLAISKELVESQGGSLAVDETPGGGATFIVTLRAG